ncbi:hypothetical protein BHM03_00055190 [Ensete ventricosum]|nr:hypothetical protein BHM03_00055190 [Ensete ventricosum]
MPTTRAFLLARRHQLLVTSSSSCLPIIFLAPPYGTTLRGQESGPSKTGSRPSVVGSHEDIGADGCNELENEVVLPPRPVQNHDRQAAFFRRPHLPGGHHALADKDKVQHRWSNAWPPRRRRRLRTGPGCWKVWEDGRPLPRLGHLHQGLSHHGTRVDVAGEGQRVFDRPLSSSLGVPSANHGLGSEQQEMKKVAGRKPAVLHQPHVFASDDAVGLDGGDLIEDEIVLPPKPTENLDGGDVPGNSAFSAAVMRCSSTSLSS